MLLAIEPLFLDHQNRHAILDQGDPSVMSFSDDAEYLHDTIALKEKTTLIFGTRCAREAR
jgi:hypothetical protein